MSSSDRDMVNPYEPPTTIDPVPAFGGPIPDPEMVKKFRQQIHALGAFWIFIGLLAITVTAFGVYGSQRVYFADSRAAVVMTIAGALGSAWCFLGVMACLKQVWAVYVGLVLSYLSLLGSAINFNLCGFVILVVVVLQGHRVISWAGRMRAAGVPLTAKP